ncbi:AraC-like DNA-binding protein [Chelatococcus caeni]|uniref:AraC-like DNA-binding protein n=1 Tax=Chelatococcus caeni TaxID=1348468 RepID=A0A840BR08_9HYPH|nr:AraC family transcriptional regulator [Chelatococcus caeni]MBB4015795.1 AraC-like DNA-binding protein [Chelatococcus caeni]
MTKQNPWPASTDGPEPPSRAIELSRRTLPPGFIHLGVAKEIVPALRDLGVDPGPLIREAGLDLCLFDDGSNVIPFTALGRLLTLGVTQSGCPHLGLLVGSRATIQSLGIVGRLMQHSQTLGEALWALVSNLSIQNRGAVPSLAVYGDRAVFSCSVYLPNVESADQISDGSIAVTVNAVRAICGPEWNPSEVLLPRARPADDEPYRRHFRAPVRFNEETASIVFPAADLDRQVIGADPLIRAVLEEMLRQMKGDKQSIFADDIRRLLRTRLTESRCSAADIARSLAMHRRTLSRHLRGCGVGYRGLANEIRFEIARQLLEDTDVPLAQIAAALGYSEASAFTRAFRRWSSLTPTAWRAERRREGAAVAQTDNRLSPLVKPASGARLQ